MSEYSPRLPRSEFAEGLKITPRLHGPSAWLPKAGDFFVRRPRNGKKDVVAAMTLWRCKGTAGLFVVAVPALGGTYCGRTLMSADDFVFQPAEGVYELLTGVDT